MLDPNRTTAELIFSPENGITCKVTTPADRDREADERFWRMKIVETRYDSLGRVAVVAFGDPEDPAGGKVWVGDPRYIYIEESE